MSLAARDACRAHAASRSSSRRFYSSDITRENTTALRPVRATAICVLAGGARPRGYSPEAATENAAPFLVGSQHAPRPTEAVSTRVRMEAWRAGFPAKRNLGSCGNCRKTHCSGSPGKLGGLRSHLGEPAPAPPAQVLPNPLLADPTFAPWQESQSAQVPPELCPGQRGSTTLARAKRPVASPRGHGNRQRQRSTVREPRFA